MFVGREEQLEQLDVLWRKNVASLVTCRGRRCIGKSTLIEEFARRSRVRFLKVEGLPPEKGVDNETQHKAFADQHSEQMGREIAQPKDWFAAFAILNPEFPRSITIDAALRLRQSLCFAGIQVCTTQQ